MRVVAAWLTTALLLLSVVEAPAQPPRRAQATGGAASATGTNSNTNTLSTGSNRNTNANSNSQFLSGNNTGVNNGSLEVYSGADPYQGIVLEGSVNLPQLPLPVQTPSNFSQPYKPESFVNAPAFLPAEISLGEAKRCRDSRVTWYGGAGDEEATTIRLYYAARQESPAGGLTMANYVGTAMASTTDGPFIAALCEAAYRAMRKGATVGVVEYSVRPKNTMFGLGFGSSGGATGLPVAGAHPYAIAGTLGFGTGWSNQRVEGEVVVQLTGLRDGPRSSTAPEPTPATLPVAPPTTEGSGTTAAPGAPPDPSGVEAARKGYEAPAAAIRLIAAGEDDSKMGPVQAQGAPPPVARDQRDETSARPRGETTYHSTRKLADVRAGLAKERVLDVFGTLVVKQKGRIVEVEGMRLRAAGRSERDTRLEVAEVNLAPQEGREAPYWFVFEDGRLFAWGRADEWDATAARLGLDLPYRPETAAVSPQRRTDLEAGR
jgi:hypothetical protein